MQVVVIVVQNEPGVLARIAGVFGRRGFNIESLAVGPSSNPGLARMTVELRTDETSARRLCRHIGNLVDVVEVQMLDEGERIARELALVKVRTGEGCRCEVLARAEAFGAAVVDADRETVILEISGGEERVSSIVAALRDFDVLEVARTGEIALARGEISLDERAGRKARAAGCEAAGEGGSL